MSGEALLGIDVGTSSVKAVILDPARVEVRAVATRPTPTGRPRSGWAEFPPGALWDAVVAAVREATTRGAPLRVVGIGIASVGEAGLPLDAQGEPLYPIIAWYDPRGAEYIRQWEREMDLRRLYAITGHHTRSIYTAFKLLWLKDHEPDVFARMHRWLFVADYIAYRLTGRQATVPTLAARSLLFDVTHRRWAKALLAHVGLTPARMPEVIPAGTPVGGLRAEVAQALGLPTGIPVTIAGHDHPVGMLVAGVQQPGVVVDSSGSAQAIAAWTPHFVGESGFAAGMTCYPAVIGSGYLVQGGLATAGAALQWAARLIGVEDVDALMAHAEQVPPGARGMGFVPFLRGAGTPYRASEARGALYHLDLDHGPEEVARAVLEGLACFLAENVDRIADLRGQPIQVIRAIGGTNRHPLFLRIKASVTGFPVVRLEVPEAVGVGAALIAGLAAGHWAGPADLPIESFVQGTLFQPIPEWQERYRHVRRRHADWVRAVLERVGQAHTPLEGENRQPPI